MDTKLFERFSPVIRSLSAAELDGAPSLNDKMSLDKEGKLEVCYAPFEWVNAHARVVIVGITPGRTQMLNAIREARQQLDRGAGAEHALTAAKRMGAFSGTMRPNLVELLDHVGINKWLGVESCDELFERSAHLLQSASVLRNPVFIDGENYSGTPNMLRNPLLREHLLNYFGKDMQSLQNAVFVPLGDKVVEALHFVADQGLLSRDRILDGLPHPSGANAERIAYFLGKKRREDLSKKTNSVKLDEAREGIMGRILALA